MNTLQQAITLIESDKWDEAHTLAQAGNDKYSYLIHGLLHRIEGDMANAAYWYNRANETLLDNSIADEINRINIRIQNHV